jgi:hypothetical protein
LNSSKSESKILRFNRQASKSENNLSSALVERLLAEGLSDALSLTRERVRVWVNAAPQRSLFAQALP